MLVPAPHQSGSIETPSFPHEGSLLMEHASDGQVTYHTTLQLVTKSWTKHMTVKVYPGVQMNTIPE